MTTIGHKAEVNVSTNGRFAPEAVIPLLIGRMIGCCEAPKRSTYRHP